MKIRACVKLDLRVVIEEINSICEMLGLMEY